jgi:hypothetical protein
MRSLIISARVHTECTYVHNDIHKHLATDGSISVTNFICFHPFVKSYGNETTIVMRARYSGCSRMEETASTSEGYLQM